MIRSIKQKQYNKKRVIQKKKKFEMRNMLFNVMFKRIISNEHDVRNDFKHFNNLKNLIFNVLNDH